MDRDSQLTLEEKLQPGEYAFYQPRKWYNLNKYNQPNTALKHDFYLRDDHGFKCFSIHFYKIDVFISCYFTNKIKKVFFFK